MCMQLYIYVCVCVQVSHDARLISATECEIWVVGDHPSGVRVERQVGAPTLHTSHTYIMLCY
jgi:hypothetical protein